MRARLAAVGLLSAVIALGPAAAAFADPATPTNYESTVATVDPGEGLEVVIVGGDAFVELRVAPGTEVLVLGYEDEPYIWFHADGTVEVNRHSPAAYLNDDRYAQVALPDEADAAAEPRWEPVATGGTYAWHDHRTHWMSRFVPAVVDEAGGAAVDIFEWRLPLEVDGAPGEITGTLAWVPDATPLPWLGLAAITGAAAGGLALRRGTGAAAAATIGGGLVALVAAIGGFLLQPPDVRSVGVELIGPLVVIAVAVYALTRSLPAIARALLIIASGALAGWAALRIDTISRPRLPTTLPYGVDRAATAVALGIGMAIVIVVAFAATRVAEHKAESAPTIT